jgi:hypothetical protein
VTGRGATDGGPPEQVDDGTPLPIPPPRPNGSILMAAMIGLANALGMERTTEPTELTQPGEPTGDGLDLDFGPLPPLE